MRTPIISYILLMCFRIISVLYKYVSFLNVDFITTFNFFTI